MPLRTQLRGRRFSLLPSVQAAALAVVAAARRHLSPLLRLVTALCLEPAVYIPPLLTALQQFAVQSLRFEVGLAALLSLKGLVLSGPVVCLLLCPCNVFSPHGLLKCHRVSLDSTQAVSLVLFSICYLVFLHPRFVASISDFGLLQDAASLFSALLECQGCTGQEASLQRLISWSDVIVALLLLLLLPVLIF